jgi:DAK2 domain fusion protein YloV
MINGLEGVKTLQSAALDSLLLREMMASATASIYLHKADVDALNVFPVPDGDTGTNMYLTFQSAYKEVCNNPSQNVLELLESAAYGALMGARGNSGVIVSQFFRGFVKALPKDTKQFTSKEIALGINGAANMAFRAVRRPVEGTILTVIKEMAKYSMANVDNNISLKEYVNNIYQHAVEVLAKTPEMLPVLKQAGVVDAGGQGLVYYIKGIIQYLNGEKVDLETINSIDQTKKVTNVTSYTENELLPEGEINFQYCTEFILKGKNLDLEHIKNHLNPHGDCLLVVGDENTVKIHLHTNNPGIVLDFAVGLGELFEIQIHNMIEQSKERLAKLAHEDGDDEQVAIVAIATGDGLERIFKSLGVKYVVNGGQTMNPSIEELAKAVSSLKAANVILLPNNSNIIMTANHVHEIVSKKVHVIPTRTIPEGLAALVSYNSESGLEDNIAKITEKVEQVISGEITYSVRSVQIGELDISQGDVIGLVDGEIVTYGTVPEDVIKNTLKRIPQVNGSLVSIYYGSDVPTAAAQELLNQLEQEFPEAEFELYYGGQPLYYYLFSVE